MVIWKLITDFNFAKSIQSETNQTNVFYYKSTSCCEQTVMTRDTTTNQQLHQHKPPTKPKMVQSQSTMRLHREFIRKMSWVEAMLHPGMEQAGTENGEHVLGRSFEDDDKDILRKHMEEAGVSPLTPFAPIKEHNTNSAIPPETLNKKTSTLPIAIPKKKRYALGLDHYVDHKKDQEFFAKKLTQHKSSKLSSSPNTVQKEKQRAFELKKLENLAREQSDVVICFITEVLHYLITSANKATPPPEPVKKTESSKTFLSFQNLKSFIFNSLRKNNSNVVPSTTADSQNSTDTTTTTTTTTGESPSTSQYGTKDEKVISEEKETIRHFLQNVISRIPVDPRLHVVALMYFDRFVQAGNNNIAKLKETPTSASKHRLTLPKHTRSKSADISSFESIFDVSKHYVNLQNYQIYFAMCIVLASKMWEDRFYSNLSYFELFSLPASVDFSRFNATEGVILDCLKFELHVNYDAFRSYIEHYSKLLNPSISKTLTCD